MAAAELPDLPYIQACAQSVGMDVTDAVTKARKVMQTDPAAVRSACERLTAILGEAEGRQGDLRLAGSHVLAGWSGNAADAFGADQTILLNEVAGSVGASRALVTDLDNIATAWEHSQRTVMTATGATAAALRMLVPGMTLI